VTDDEGEEESESEEEVVDENGVVRKVKKKRGQYLPLFYFALLFFHILCIANIVITNRLFIPF
jgi:hypothetical protein